MRRAIIKDNDPSEKEQPIRYSLTQFDGYDGKNGYVVLEATVGAIMQTLLVLEAHTIKKVGAVSDKIGLPTGRRGAVIIEEYP